MKIFVVYILTNASRRTLYTGITSRIRLRAFQHKHKVHNGFTAKYNVHCLVYYECYCDPWSAITREKQIKGWLRAKKIALTESVNPRWDDLTGNWESLFLPIQNQHLGPSLGSPALVKRAGILPVAQDDILILIIWKHILGLICVRLNAVILSDRG